VTEIVKGAAKRQQQLLVDSFGRVTSAHFQKNWQTPAPEMTPKLDTSGGAQRCQCGANEGSGVKS